MSSPEELASAYRALAHRAWATNRARAAELTALVAQWRDAGEIAAEPRERGRAVAHSLRGSAGTFGHDRAASAAEKLDRILASSDETPELDVVADLVGQIDRALAQAPDPLS